MPAATSPDSWAGTAFRDPVTVLAMWAIHRADGKLPRVLEINLCGTNILITLDAHRYTVSSERSGGRFRDQQDQNWGRVLTNLENTTPVWESGPALPPLLVYHKNCQFPYPRDIHPLPTSARGQDADHHTVALRSNRLSPRSARLSVMAVTCVLTASCSC